MYLYEWSGKHSHKVIMSDGKLGQIDRGTHSSPRTKNKDSRLYVTGEATVLIQDITGYAVICNKIDRKIKFRKCIIYDHN